MTAVNDDDLINDWNGQHKKGHKGKWLWPAALERPG